MLNRPSPLSMRPALPKSRTVGNVRIAVRRTPIAAAAIHERHALGEVVVARGAGMRE
jgi:hypothetical protein